MFPFSPSAPPKEPSRSAEHKDAAQSWGLRLLIATPWSWDCCCGKGLRALALRDKGREGSGFRMERGGCWLSGAQLSSKGNGTVVSKEERAWWVSVCMCVVVCVQMRV